MKLAKPHMMLTEDTRRQTPRARSAAGYKSNKNGRLYDGAV